MPEPYKTHTTKECNSVYILFDTTWPQVQPSEVRHWQRAIKERRWGSYAGSIQLNEISGETGGEGSLC